MLGNIKIRIHNEEYRKAVIERLFELGYSWVNEGIRFTDCKSIHCRDTGNMFQNYSETGFNESDNKKVTLDDLYKISKEKSVKLNDDYNAVVKDGFVEIGFTKIPFEKIDELHNLIHS